jgi:hypothetical protein
MEEGAKMPEEKYVSIIELLANKKLFINGKTRSKSGFIRLLRQTFHLNLLMVRFPGQGNGRAITAITEKDANALIESLTKPQVVSQDQEK